jgi:sulfoxide reductase heme-binding subunit YedZ
MPRRREILNGWRLFWLVLTPMSLVVGSAIARADLSSAEDISSLIQLSVRLSVPWLYLAFAASSIQSLLPGAFSRWLMRNRRIVGLCFAGGMAWQLLFIVWLVTGFRAYYAEEVYAFFDIIVQVPGYVFLSAMTLTSFMPVRRKLSSRQWRTLHTTGIYFLWGTVWSTYWYELYYYDDIQPIDYVYYWAGFLVWAMRLVAWGTKRARDATT